MIQQIKIKTQDDPYSEIKTEIVNSAGDNLVIHRTAIRNDGSDCEYQFTRTITHRPTGRRIIVCRNLLHAKTVKEQLEKLAIDWSLDDIKELNRQQKKTDFSSIYWENDIQWELKNA